MKYQDRVSKMATTFAEHTTVPPNKEGLCSASAAVLNVSSAGMALMSGQHSSPVCSSDDRANELDEMQFSLGEGPGLDAYVSRVPVFEPDLERAQRGRWPHFTPVALESGTRGVFAFPLLAGSSCIGVLTLYQDAAGDLTADQAADGLVLADTLVRFMLKIQSAGGPDILGHHMIDSDSHRAEVHQASGMVAVQLGINVSDSAVRLRAHAYATNRSVAEVARDVVARRLRLSDDTDPNRDGRVM